MLTSVHLQALHGGKLGLKIIYVTFWLDKVFFCHDLLKLMRAFKRNLNTRTEDDATRRWCVVTKVNGGLSNLDRFVGITSDAPLIVFMDNFSSLFCLLPVIDVRVVKDIPSCVFLLELTYGLELG